MFGNLPEAKGAFLIFLSSRGLGEGAPKQIHSCGPFNDTSLRDSIAVPHFGAHSVICRARRHTLATPPSHSFAHLNLHRARVCRTRRRLPSSRCIESAQPHPCPEPISPTRASDTALRLTRQVELVHRVGPHRIRLTKKDWKQQEHEEVPDARWGT